MIQVQKVTIVISVFEYILGVLTAITIVRSILWVIQIKEVTIVISVLEHILVLTVINLIKY